MLNLWMFELIIIDVVFVIVGHMYLIIDYNIFYV